MAVDFLGMKWRHTDGSHQTAFRHSCLGQGNITVVVKDGEVAGAVCPTCGSKSFVVLVEGRDVFWPVPEDHVI